MFLATMSLTLTISITILITMIITMIKKKCLIDAQKTTPFECGFNPMSYTRIPFSIHFFLVAVIFLIFDIEIILIMPMILTLKTSMIKMWLTTTISFTIILLLGLIYEWSNGMISWAS